MKDSISASFTSFFAFLLLFISPFCLFSQEAEQWSTAKLEHELNRINTLGSVLYIAAHPDDENTRLISWLVGEKKLRTAYVSLTRGDGGQNLLGKEQGPLLGLIRTQELLAARRIDGAEQYFTRAYDFGFSKSPDETLRLWNKDSITKDLVGLIRQLQPDVIICRFPTTGEGGHGHHTASAILAKEAFVLAANPNYEVNVPSTPWQAKGLFWNTYSFGTVNTISEDQIKVDAGTYNPLLGISYGEIASLSRSQHKSQGFGSAALRGEVKEYFVQWAGDTVKNDLFEFVDMSWSRIDNAKLISNHTNAALAAFSSKNRASALPHLLNARKEVLQLLEKGVNDSNDQLWLKYKLSKLEELIYQSIGLWASASVTQPSLVPGDSVEPRFDFIHRWNNKVKILNANFGNELLLNDSISSNNQLVSVKKKCLIDSENTYSTPYWLVNGIQNHLFQPKSDLHGLSAEISNSPNLDLQFELSGQKFDLQLPLTYRYVSPVDGELFQPLKVFPPVTLQWSENIRILPEKKPVQVSFQVKAQSADQKGTVSLEIPEGWNSRLISSSIQFDLKQKGDVANFTWEIEAKNSDEAIELKAVANIDDEFHSFSVDEISYGHIPHQIILKEAVIKMVPLDIKVNQLSIGYIPGAGDDIPLALKQLGYEVTTIDETNFESLDFKQFASIVTGVRAYNNHLWLNDAYPKLMNYVEQGGNLLVQYNTNNRIGPLVAKMSPYPFEITRDRVTDESAKLNFLDENHSILNYPNKISAQDFENWVQERGIYFVGKRDSSYQSIFAMNDPDEAVLDGGLIVANYGKGRFIYTGLSLFRQIPAGISGAYRLMVNMIEKK